MKINLITQLIGGVLILLLFFIALWWYGHSRYEDGYKAASVQSLIKQQKVIVAQNKVTTKVITKYIPKLHVVYMRGKTIIKEVPVYVTNKDNSKCIINTGFVQLWNSANGVPVSNTTRTANETPSPVKLSDVEAEHARESTICAATQLQLISLQKWIHQEQIATH